MNGAGRRLLACALAVGGSLALAAPATGDFRQIYNDFANDGQLNACAYTDGQLSDGARGIPPDIAQYAPGFADQINAAREQRAGGACSGGGGGGPADAEAVAAAAGGGGSGGGGGGSRSTVPDPPTPPLPERAVVAGGVPAPAAPAVPLADAASKAGAGWLLTLIAAGGLGAGALVLTRRRGRLSGAVRRVG